MERRLLRGIINPAMIAVWIFGLALAWQGAWWHAGWWQMKFGFVIGLTFIHHLYARWRKDFANDNIPGLPAITVGGTRCRRS